MAKFKIIPTSPVVGALTADSKESAMDEFVLSMDMDMNNYFKVEEISNEEFDQIVNEYGEIN